mmetsp:Transcript_38405/g.75401  ORF Transcript_38405/g.75401 Transcript_38405/m.75401 type:complete len:107 (+) Transcript_38405:125-445(+)
MRVMPSVSSRLSHLVLSASWNGGVEGACLFLPSFLIRLAYLLQFSPVRTGDLNTCVCMSCCRTNKKEKGIPAATKFEGGTCAEFFFATRREEKESRRNQWRCCICV